MHEHIRIALVDAFCRLESADQMTLAAQYAENLHRIGAVDDAGKAYTLTEFLHDVCEVHNYDIAPTEEFAVMMQSQAEQTRADMEICTDCPTHCSPCGGDHRWIDTFDPTTWACEMCGATTPATVTE